MELTEKKYIPISVPNKRLWNENPTGNKKENVSLKSVYVETYGCQMNFADTEIVNGIMSFSGFSVSEDIKKASLILLNTCSIRENAELRIYQRLTELKKLKAVNPSLMIGIIGCMAERLRKDIIKKSKVVDLVVGPDEYRKLPVLVEALEANSEKGVAVRLSRVETYDDITPLRKDGITAWLSIMRGCDKFCSFCVVPYTRGRERSRPLNGVIDEVNKLYDSGFKEVTLLGQNVNSYKSDNYDFSDLLAHTARAVPGMRIRFTTSHPQDLSLKLIETIAQYENLCNYIHLPIQSGSDRILSLMKRSYDLKHYMSIIEAARKIIPGVSLSTDIISGFPTETEEDHKLTLKVMEEIEYDGAYMFKYSPREKTKAYDMADDTTEGTKTRRLMEIIELQSAISSKLNEKMVGKDLEILIESISKKSKEMFTGRTDGNRSVIVPKNGFNIGDLVKVNVTRSNSATLFAEPVYL